jgi:arginase family enzyme
MPLDVPYLIPKPGWATGSVVDPAYSKLGLLLSDADDLGPGGFAYFGIPFEGLLVNEVGGKGGPDGLRAALSRLRPYSIELDVNFIESSGLADLGDIEVDYLDYGPTFDRAARVFEEVLRRGWTPVVAGGSHSITEPILRTFSDAHQQNIGVIWIDGHPDLMDDFKGDRHYNGCPLRRNIESGHVNPERVAIMGLRSFSNAAADIRFGRDAGITMRTTEEVRDRGIDAIIDEAIAVATDGTDAFYVSFDTDALDHAYAPGTQYPGSGGFQPWEVMRFLRRVGLAGAGAIDVTEFAPPADPQRSTGGVLAAALCEFMSGRAVHDRGSARV